MVPSRAGASARAPLPRRRLPCAVCDQTIDPAKAEAGTLRALLYGFALYSWCPGCLQSVPRPWRRDYRARWIAGARERAHDNAHDQGRHAMGAFLRLLLADHWRCRKRLLDAVPTISYLARHRPAPSLPERPRP